MELQVTSTAYQLSTIFCNHVTIGDLKQFGGKENPCNADNRRIDEIIEGACYDSIRDGEAGGADDIPDGRDQAEPAE